MKCRPGDLAVVITDIVDGVSCPVPTEGLLGAFVTTVRIETCRDGISRWLLAVPLQIRMQNPVVDWKWMSFHCTHIHDSVLQPIRGDTMTKQVTSVSYWKPSLSESDTNQLQSLGLCGSTIKGNPYRSHLKRPGAAKALCGAQPGNAKSHGSKRMIDRTGWLVHRSLESPGRTPCEACLKAVEELL